MNGFSARIFNGKIEVTANLETDYDNIHFVKDEIEFVFKGMLLNKKLVMDRYAAPDFETLLTRLFLKKKSEFLTELEGEFSGLVHDKSNQKLVAFTNPTSTQKVFYSKTKFGVFINSSLVHLNEILCRFEKTSPNLGAMYQVLAVGNMLEDTTPVSNIFKLLDGHFLEADSLANVDINTYYSAVSEQKFTGSLDSAIRQINQVFAESVKLEYEKEAELNTSRLALLSGGLDSRISLFSAVQQGWKPDVAFCFSQSRYYDEIISRQIAGKLYISHEFIPLDGGDFLKSVDEVVKIGEGCTVFSGAPHVFHAVKNLKFEDFKIFHSGQIGDGVLGGFNSQPKFIKPNTFKIIDDIRFLPKIKTQLENCFKKHETEEAFLLRNLAFNRTVLGGQVLQEKAIQTSPFMTKDFMALALSLPEAWKFRHKFYIQWVKTCFPEAAKYRWERTLMKPNAHWKTYFGDYVLKRANKLLFSKIIKNPHLTSMYPYRFYFDNSEDIKSFYRDYFNKNSWRIEKYPELAADVARLFRADDYYGKAKALHILAVFKLFFGNE